MDCTNVCLDMKYYTLVFVCIANLGSTFMKNMPRVCLFESVNRQQYTKTYMYRWNGRGQHDSHTHETHSLYHPTSYHTLRNLNMHSRSSDQKQLVHSNGQDDIHCTSNSITSIKSGSRNNEYMVYCGIPNRKKAPSNTLLVLSWWYLVHCIRSDEYICIWNMWHFTWCGKRNKKSDTGDRECPRVRTIYCTYVVSKILAKKVASADDRNRDLLHPKQESYH